MPHPSLSFSAFRFVLSPEEAMSFPPYIGATLRGGFGYALKRLVCLQKGRACPECILKAKCAYFHIFESPNVTGEAGRRANYDPHPFLFEAPSAPRTQYDKGDELAFNLILVGQGIDYLAYFVVAFEELGRTGMGGQRSRFRLARVEDALSGAGTMVYDGHTKSGDGRFITKTSTDVAEETTKLDPRRICLSFQTPTRLKQQRDFVFVSPEKGQSHQQLVSDLDFPLFMRSLLRRLSWLAELYCGEKWDLDYRELLDLAAKVKTTSSALRWHDWGRYSTRQNTHMKMGGFVGQVAFEGDLAPFLAYIKSGEYLHIGKGTAFGLGKYVIEPVSTSVR